MIFSFTPSFKDLTKDYLCIALGNDTVKLSKVQTSPFVTNLSPEMLKIA